jgi:hypothetical protein
LPIIVNIAHAAARDSGRAMTREAAGLSKVDTAAGRLQRACLERLRAHERQPDGLPTSVRFIFYEFVKDGAVAKDKKSGRRSDQNIADAIFRLREIGLVPWDWIADETRQLHDWNYAPCVADYVADAVDRARIDLWDRETPPAILTESRSLGGVLRNLAYEYLAPIAPTNGQVGGFLRTDVAPALTPRQRVLYLGDFDWQGAQIEANTRRVLEQLIGGELDWERVALTEAQVRRHRLPVIQKADHRYKPVRYHDAVECEALEQSFIVGLVRRRLNALLPEPLADVRVREAAQRKQVRAALTKLARRR